jgi:hypothetical protein
MAVVASTVWARQWWWFTRAAEVVLWWCGQRSWGGEGGGAGVAAATDRWGRRCWPVARVAAEFFLFGKTSSTESQVVHGTRVPRASEVALGKEPCAGPAVPRVPFRHRLCREYSSLCREELALGTAPDSGSAWTSTSRRQISVDGTNTRAQSWSN